MGGNQSADVLRSWHRLYRAALFEPTPGATAQNPKTVHAAASFEFWVEGNCLPTADYIIEHVESRSSLLFRIRGGKNAAALYALPVDGEPATEVDSKLVFKVENGGIISMEAGDHLPGVRSRRKLLPSPV